MTARKFNTMVSAFVVDVGVSIAGSLITPVMVFLCVPLAVGSLPTQEVAAFLVLLSLGRLVAGFDFGIAQLATPRFIRAEKLGVDVRLRFCVRSITALVILMFVGSLFSLGVLKVFDSELVGRSFFSDLMQVFVLAVGFSLTTFSREIAMVTGAIATSLLLSAPLSGAFLVVILSVSVASKAYLAFTLSTYLATQAFTVITAAIRTQRYSLPTALPTGQSDAGWRIAGQMQVISLGNLAAVQIPVSVAAVLLSPSDVVFVGVAFQVAGATRLLGGSVAPFLLARMARMTSLGLAEGVSRARKYWWGLLAAGAASGVASAGFIASRVFTGEKSRDDLWLGVAWGFVWAAVALIPLLTTTALRSRLRLQVERGLAMMAIVGVAALGAVVSLSESPLVLLGGSLSIAAAVSFAAEWNGERQLRAWS